MHSCSCWLIVSLVTAAQKAAAPSLMRRTQSQIDTSVFDHHCLVLQLGAHMLRLHVVLSADSEADSRQPDLAVLTGKAGRDQGGDSPSETRKVRVPFWFARMAAAATNVQRLLALHKIRQSWWWRHTDGLHTSANINCNSRVSQAVHS